MKHIIFFSKFKGSILWNFIHSDYFNYQEQFNVTIQINNGISFFCVSSLTIPFRYSSIEIINWKKELKPKLSTMTTTIDIQNIIVDSHLSMNTLCASVNGLAYCLQDCKCDDRMLVINCVDGQWDVLPIMSNNTWRMPFPVEWATHIRFITESNRIWLLRTLATHHEKF